MPVTVLVPRQYTRAEKMASYEEPGKPSGRVPGGWVADLAGAQKTILLCPFCVAKFNPRKNDYEVWRRDIYAQGRCDGCNQHSPRIHVFNHQSLHDAVGEGSRPRSRGRWARS